MSHITTNLTKLLGIRTPIICGAMARASGGKFPIGVMLEGNVTLPLGSLAAQVSLGGGFGFIGAGYEGVDKLKAEVDIARSLLRVTPQSTLPIGIGYLGWQLEQPGAHAFDYLDVALDNKTQAVWLSFGERIEDWIAHIRKKESTPGATKIFVQVSTVEQALGAIQDWKADVVVAQGVEAGGHGLGSGFSMMTLLSEILSLVPEDGPPVLAAGGMVHGGHLASIITLGASGAVFGTRFLLSPESLYSDAQRQALIAAKTSSSVRSMAFDQARNTLEWPHGVDGRGLRNALVDDFEKGIDMKTLRRNLAEGTQRSDPNRMIIWAGTGVGMLTKSQPAKEVVEEIHQECIHKLVKAASLVQ